MGEGRQKSELDGRGHHQALVMPKEEAEPEQAAETGSDLDRNRSIRTSRRLATSHMRLDSDQWTSFIAQYDRSRSRRYALLVAL